MPGAVWKMKGRGGTCQISLTSCCLSGFENEERQKSLHRQTCNRGYVHQSACATKNTPITYFIVPSRAQASRTLLKKVAPLRDDLRSSLTPCARCGQHIGGDGTENGAFWLRTENR